jgi:4-amino-4-deoxy-L-arabinose transferase-like glycosyltransferase
MALRLSPRLRDAPSPTSELPLPPDATLAGRPESTTRRPRERDLIRLGVAGALLGFVTLATVYVYRMPVYRPPDEASHVGYARELSRGRLPTIKTPIPSDGDPRLEGVLGSRDAAHRTIWTASHPPLYYALAAIPLRAGTATDHPVGGVQAARLLSVGLSALGLVVLAYLVLQLAPGRPQLAVAATGLVALLPSFISVSAMVYNDSLAFLTSTAALAAAVVFVLRGPSAARLAAVAATAGLAALARASGLLVVGIAGLAVLVGVWRTSEGRVLRRLWRAIVWAGAVGVAVAGIAGWFYLRSLARYGDLTGSAAICGHFPYCAPNGSVLAVLTDPGFWLEQQQRLSDATYNLAGSSGSLTRQLWLLALVPLAGLLLAGARGRSRLARGGTRPDPAGMVAVALCVLLLGLLQLSVVRFISDGGNLHVRYLFPGLVAAGLAAAVGLAALPGGRRGLPTFAMLLAAGAATLWVSWRYLDVVEGVRQRAPLVVVVPLLLVGIGLQASALWHLPPRR